MGCASSTSTKGAAATRAAKPPQKAEGSRLPAKSKALSAARQGADQAAAAAARLHLPKPYEFASQGDFAKTRYAGLWVKHGERIHNDLENLAKQVDSDDMSAHAWTMFVRARKATPEDNGALLQQAHDPAAAAAAAAAEGAKPNTAFPDIVDEPGLIESVFFQLHPTFSPPKLTLTEPPFEITRVGWGTFTIALSIRMHGGVHLDVSHGLLLSQQHRKLSCVYKVATEQHGTVLVEVGNVHSHVEDSTEGPLLDLATQRKNRKERLLKAKARVDNLIAAQGLIDAFIAGRPVGERKMALGAVLACLFAGRDMDHAQFTDLQTFALGTLRGVELTEANMDNVQDILVHKRVADAWACSRPVNKLDCFVSHSWFDSPHDKAAALRKWSADFAAREGRAPVAWLDLFCLEQTHEALAKSVTCLPIYLLACDKVVLLRSVSLCSRLWCLTEAYTCYVSQLQTLATNAAGFEVVDVTPVASLPSRINVVHAKCTLASDQEALLANLDRAPGGIDSVETVVNQALGLFEVKMATRAAHVA